MSDFVRVRLTGEAARRAVKSYRVSPAEWGRVVEACDWYDVEPGVVARELLVRWAERELAQRDALDRGSQGVPSFAQR